MNAPGLTPIELSLVRALTAAVLRELRTGTDERPERLDLAAGRDDFRDDKCILTRNQLFPTD